MLDEGSRLKLSLDEIIKKRNDEQAKGGVNGRRKGAAAGLKMKGRDHRADTALPPYEERHSSIAPGHGNAQRGNGSSSNYIPRPTMIAAELTPGEMVRSIFSCEFMRS